MITPEETRKAVEYLVTSAAAWGHARARQTKAEDMLKVVRALAAAASDETSAAAKERDALASKEYMNAVQEHFEAVKAAQEIYALREAAKMKIEFFRSVNANQRAAERGFHA